MNHLTRSLIAGVTLGVAVGYADGPAPQPRPTDALDPVVRTSSPPAAQPPAAARRGSPAIVSRGLYAPHDPIVLNLQDAPPRAAVVWKIKPKPAGLLDGPRGAKHVWAAPGKYEVAVTVITVEMVDNEPVPKVEELESTFTVGDPVPPTPPKPVDPPKPPEPPAPIAGDGLRVLIVAESADLAKVPAGVVDSIMSAEVRDYLKAKCAKSAGGTPEFRYWDKDTDATGDASTALREAFKRPRQSLPWIIVSNGRTGYEGPVPAGVPAMMELLRKYGGQ